MKNDIKIKINKNGEAILSNSILGVNNENIVSNIVFSFSDEFVDGVAWLEVEKPSGTKGYIELTKTDETYTLPIKSSLLDEVGLLKMNLRITEEGTEIPVFKSLFFYLKVESSINSTETIPDEYPAWIDTANAKIIEINNLETTVETNEATRQSNETSREEYITQLKQDVEDGKFKGEKGDKGDKGDVGPAGALSVKLVSTLPETGEEGTIYLVPKTTTETQNIYDEYMYINDKWELIGSRMLDVDMSQYYNKTEINSLINGKEDKTNKTTSIDENSTDEQYPSAKAVYTIVGNIETALNTILGDE